jgi:RHS repeat-associated protein
MPSGLDYFGARYFSSAQGRFTSSDPKQFSKRTIANPQKWNKYAYVLNNPLRYSIPTVKRRLR